MVIFFRLKVEKNATELMPFSNYKTGGNVKTGILLFCLGQNILR